jgi:hypothetical protein
MARIKEHMNDCEELLGNPWERVHKFLDQYAELFPVEIFTEYHRGFLHNRYGIEVVRAMWGIEAGQAAIIHIVRDYIEQPIRKWKQVNIHYGKALIYFNRLENLEPHIQPHIIVAWKGESLVSIALGEEKK